jgi:hypothetical protein
MRIISQIEKMLNEMKSLLDDDFRIYFESVVEQMMPAKRIR